MPWPIRDLLTMKQELVEFALRPGVNRRELFSRYGISAPCAYKWLKRYQSQGVEGLAEHSRRPHHHPAQIGPEIVLRVLEVRDQYPAWGGRKIYHYLRQRAFGPLPAPSTITEILRRNGRLSPQHPSAQGPWHRFEHSAANDLWQMDFKGPLQTLRAGRCHPLGLLDDYSRFALALEACPNQSTPTVQARLQSIFARYGLPRCILCDNGGPWGCVESSSRYTELGVWLLRLGVDVRHGRPFHPQTQGKEERFHGTLQVELLNQTLPWLDLAHCQAGFDHFRQSYNFVRPHQALQYAVPASRYQPSVRCLPLTLAAIDYLSSDQVRIVKSKGEVTFRNQFFYIGRAFVGLPIAFRQAQSPDSYEVFFSWKRLGFADLACSQKIKYRYHSIYLDPLPF